MINNLLILGGNDPFTKRLSVVGSPHERDILAKAVVRSLRTVSYEIRMEWNRNGCRIVTNHNQLEGHG